MTTTNTGERFPVRPQWLDLRREDIIEPALPIIDTHHHLRESAGQRYLFDEILADVNSGHNIIATVFMQSGTKTRSMYRADGDPDFAPVGETEFANGVAAMSASGAYGRARVCAGIIGAVDMRLGARVRPVLEAHIGAGGDRFRGIRDSMTWDAWEGLCPPPEQHRKAVLGSPAMREALACFAPLGLLFEAWVFYPQMNELIALVRDFPDTQFVLNHLGGPLHIGPYADDRARRFDEWRTAIRAIAQLPNVTCKLGAIGMHYAGFDFHAKPQPPSSQMLCDAWRPYIETCVEAFGAGRCMAESNFPVDKASCSYAILWNAFKRMVGGASAGEKAQIFSGTARRVYRLEKVAPALP
jgi:L-fuconolactonase